MNKKSLTSSLTYINKAKQQGYVVEGLIRYHLLNSEILGFILAKCISGFENSFHKPKHLMQILQQELKRNAPLRKLMNKRNFKLVKIWLEGMDLYFKQLKTALPQNSEKLFSEAEQASDVLIAVMKFLSDSKQKSK